MKPRQSQIRAREFEVEDLGRQLRLFDQMIADLKEIREELDRQVTVEEDRTGVRDPSHFAYSTVARAARDRRRKLDASIADLSDRRGAVETRLAEAEAALEALRAEAEEDHRTFARPLEHRYQVA